MKPIIVFLSLPLLFIGCTVFEPWEEVYYHDVGAEGCLYYNDKPIQNKKIWVENDFISKGYATKDPINEMFISDENGYFCVKFVRRTGHENVIKYSIGFFSNDSLYYDDKISFSPEEVKKAKKNIDLGRLNLQKKHSK